MTQHNRHKGSFQSRVHTKSDSGDNYRFIPRYTQITLECEILSPVHVGTGEEIPVYEYIISNSSLFKINLDKAITLLSPDELSKFNRFNEKANYTGLRAFLANKYSDSKFREKVTEFAVPVTREVEEIYKDKIDDTENQLLIRLNQRNPLTKEVIIPGSSIKGAIRTALLAMLERTYGKRIQGNASKVEGELLGALTKRDRVNPLRDPFKHLKVEDVSLSDNSTYISKVKNAIKSEEKFLTVDIQMTHEVTNSVLSSETIKFTFNLLHSSEMKIFNQKPPLRITSDLLIESCKAYYKERLEKIEARYFSNTPVENEINRLYNAVDYAKGEFLLRVGRFSGKMSITLDKHRTGKDPKSRNLADGKYPMGWIKCKPVA